MAVKAHLAISGFQREVSFPAFAKLPKAMQIAYLRQIQRATSRRFVSGYRAAFGSQSLI
jgi:hypothetical protein